MKSRVGSRKVIKLVLYALLVFQIAGCGLLRGAGTAAPQAGAGNAEPTQKGVIHFPEINKKEWVTSISKLCVQVEQSYSGVSGISEPIAEEIQSILDRIGVETTIGESPDCQANLKIVLAMTPVGEHVIGAGTCYFQASADGTATLSASGKKDLSLKLSRTVSTGGSGFTFVYSCPSMEKANYASAWGYAIAPIFGEWWGAPALVSALRSENYAISNQASGKLADMGVEASGALPVLIEMLKDVDPNAREAAARTLGQFGPAAKEAVPGLINLVTDANYEVKSAAIRALAAIGDPQAIPVMMDLLDSSDTSAKVTAIEALGTMKAVEAVPRLVQLMDNEEYTVSYAALEALQKIGPEAKEAVLPLIEKLEKGSTSMDYMVRNALESITGQELGEDASAWRKWYEGQK